MENQFKWKIDNFTEFKATRKASQSFSACGYQWKATICAKRKNMGYLSFHLDAEDHVDVRNTRFKVAVIDQVNGNNKTITKEAENDFARGRSWHLLKLIHLDELCHSDSGYVLNNTCIVEIDISVDKEVEKISVSSGDLRLEKTQDFIPLLKEDHMDGKTEQVYIPLLEEEDHMDGLGNTEHDHMDGKAEQVYIPLLEEEDHMDVLGNTEHHFIPLLKDVFKMHPSLINFFKNIKSTPQFRGWACTALGRVLSFLKTQKLKDMDKEACSTLQTLWLELKTIGFDDLKWLQPHVESALLGAQGHISRNSELKRMRDGVVDIEKNIRNGKKKVKKMERDLETLKTQLVEVENQFAEKDLNDVIGY